MKSKTFCFNKTIFKKNFVLFWPIWICFLLIELIKGPIYLWFSFEKYRSGKLEILFGELNLTVDLILVTVASVIIGMALFNYLFVPKNAYMIHALPVTRSELYWTNLVSGYTFLFLPEILVFLVSVLLCLSHGVAEVQYLGIWLLINLGMSFFFFSVVALCAMFTGQMFALPILFVICNVLVEGVILGLSTLVNMMAYGVSENVIQESRLCILSPFMYLWNRLKMKGIFQAVDQRGSYELTEIQVLGYKAVILYVIVAIFLYALAYVCYQKRDIERAGDLFTFNRFRPLFRWGIGGCLGFVIGTMIMSFIKDMKPEASILAWAILILLFSVLFFFLVEILIEKTIHVFTIRRGRECIGFSILVLLGFGGTYAYSFHEANLIPMAKDVQYAYVDMNYPVEFSGDDIEDVLLLQRMILEKHSRMEDELAEHEMENGFGHVAITYVMKDGNRISRNYRIPSGADVSNRILNQIYEWECEGGHFLRQYVEYDYANLKRITEAQVEWYDSDTDFYTTRVAEGPDAEKVYEALLLDAAEGNIQKYNLTDYRLTWEERTAEPSAFLYVFFNHENENWQSMYDRVNGVTEKQNAYMTDDKYSVYVDSANSNLSGSIYVSFGEECRHIINTLLECGLIDSEDEIEFMAGGYE